MSREKKVTVFSSNGNDPWQWEEIKLRQGSTVRVRAIPSHLADAAMASVPIPTPPILEIRGTAPGSGVERRQNFSDPEYLAKITEATRERNRLLYTFQYSWGVEAEIPESDSWKRAIEEYLPNIDWVPGVQGMKADYIRYVLLQYKEDFEAVHNALDGIKPITREEVEAVQDSFRD